ncbi:P-loop NTPase fold protein [Streptomyces sp. R35]|uniref:P-loop NTPase fold protein n=1 Tax=Streptomyces sp. R35 TaxID=3238630 RepID=A0AB39SMH0_9ACTN
MLHGSHGGLDPDDLIQDREVEDAQSDRLAHSHVADQLRDVSLSVPAPTNVAVWGPWGSGKSGVANLLKGQLQRERDVRFVHFDAFKYAENPLRRNFIIAVATALGIKDQRFHEELYSGRVTAELKFGQGDIRRLLITFAQMFGAVVAFFAAAMALLAWVRGGAFRPAFADLATGALKAGIAPAALLTSLTVLVSRTLTREHKTEAAGSDEQFEKLFAELVARSRMKRLVIFVDELDRCAPKDVVATLDALRTFLGVNGCVFIVAADQQALEEALTRALEQATPADTVNPYYSSGSGYLDKVFQYQISLPPLLVPKVTGFAAGLVRERGGLWAEIDVDLIVSILVPSHVRSPRRVKALLNTFALTYRLAERRAAEGLLETNPATRAEEIAKLVCLRVEFPLFARDLLLDHRLCEYVLALDADKEADLGAHVRRQVRDAALRYASLEAAVDRQLSSSNGEDGEESSVRTHHGRQLVAYLKRTKKVAGPGRDLVFMETSGSIFGLPASLAEALEQQAQNADLDQLSASVAGLPAAERPAVLALLLQQVRDAIGLEETNIATAVLSMCGDEAVSLNALADAAVETLAPILTMNPQELPEEVLAGCWRLALASDRPAALEMRQVTLRHSALDDSAPLAAQLLASPQPALTADPQRVHALVCRHLVGEDDAMANMLTAVSPQDAAAMMALVGAELSKQVLAVFEAHDEWTDSQTTQSESVTVAPDEADDLPEPLDPSVVLERLSGLLEHWCRTARPAAHAVVGLLLGLNHKQGRDIVEQFAAEIPPVTDVALARSVLSATERRHVPLWSRWLGLLDAQLAIGDLEEQFNRLLAKLWNETRSADKPLNPAVVTEAADSFMRLFNQPRGEHPDITPFILQQLSAPTSDEEAAEQMRLLTARLPMESSGLLDRAAFTKYQAATMAELLSDAGEPDYSLDGPLLAYVEAVTGDCLRDLGSPVDDVLDAQEACALVRAIDGCSWLPAHDHTQLRIRARSLLTEGGVGTDELPPLPTASDMADYAAHRRSRAGEVLADWVTLTQPSATVLLSAVSAAMRQPSSLQTNPTLLQTAFEI